MRGAIVLLEKDGILIRTSFTSTHDVRWLEGEKPLAEVLSSGFQIVPENKMLSALHNLERLRDRVCYGYKPTNTDLLDIIKLLRDF